MPPLLFGTLKIFNLTFLWPNVNKLASNYAKNKILQKSSHVLFKVGLVYLKYKENALSLICDMENFHSNMF